MSLPRDILDQLLSGYIDDALSDDERAQIEQLLREDSGAARELQDLLGLRDSLRELRREDQELTLGPNFADRVLKATVDQATAEGLGDEHPVMRLTEQPSTRVAHKDFPVLKIAGAVAALAASIIFAIVMLSPSVDDPEQDLVVQKDPSPEVIDPVNIPPEEVSPAIPGPDKRLVQDVPLPPEVPNSVGMPNENDTNSLAEVPPGVPADLDLEAMLTGMVMVIDVRQTELGRQRDTISKAMNEAGLATLDQKRLDKNVVGFGKELVDDDGRTDAEADVSVLYLVDSATNIDSFINLLCVDLDGIESIGFDFVIDAPIVGLAAELKRIDELEVTEVGRGMTLELADNGNGALRVIAHQMGDRNFKPLNRNAGIADLIGKKRNDGKNFWTSVFVLVR